MNLERGLVGHWPLTTDTDDHSQTGLAAVNHGVQLGAVGRDGQAAGAARFDGRGAYIEAADHPSLAFGAGDFAVSVWVHTETDLGDVVGDIAGKYDPATRGGFNFNVVTHAGVTNAHSNERNVHFGIDNGRIDPGWTDCGRPGNAWHIASLVVFEGDLYAATMEPGAGDAGHLYRYEGDGRWRDCGSPLPCNTVNALAVHEGALFCGTLRYRLAGSCLPDSPNKNPGGRVFRYEGEGAFSEIGRLDEGDGVHCLVSFKGRLYANAMYDNDVLVWEGGTKWAPTGLDARVMCLGFWNGDLYALTTGATQAYRLEADGRWAELGRPWETRQLYSFAVYQGRPHIGTWPYADVFRFEGPDNWTKVGSPGYSKETMGMAVYNGKLYAGVLPMAEVHRYDGEEDGQTWTRTGTLDNTPDVTLRRAWSMAVHGGKLYCGTLPSGHALALEAGKMATYDHPLPGGWHHLAAVREGGRLRIVLDGKTVAESTGFNAQDFDLTNDQPLRIGFGAHDYFNGLMSDLRIYNRALEAREISALADRSS